MDGDDEIGAQVIVADYDQGLALASRPRRTADEARAAPKVLVFTSRCSEAEVHSALRAGVFGYLVQGCSPQDTIQAVRSVHRGARYFCSLASKRMADSLAHSALTEREIEVLNRLADGLSNKLIARHFDLAVDTVKSHVGSILGKLGASSRTHAVVVAADRGLVQRRLVGIDRP
jgi:DNA-binding NarL/FixJ family response regulator